jgi:hypothetical protein
MLQQRHQLQRERRGRRRQLPQSQLQRQLLQSLLGLLAIAAMRRWMSTPQRQRHRQQPRRRAQPLRRQTSPRQQLRAKGLHR